MRWGSRGAHEGFPSTKISSLVGISKLPLRFVMRLDPDVVLDSQRYGDRSLSEKKSLDLGGLPVRCALQQTQQVERRSADQFLFTIDDELELQVVWIMLCIRLEALRWDGKDYFCIVYSGKQWWLDLSISFQSSTTIPLGSWANVKWYR